MTAASLTGTAAMARLVLRRDRVRLLVWVLAVVALLLVSVASVTSLYVTDAQRQSYAAAVGDNPVAVMMGGPGAGLPSIGGIVVFETAVVGYVAVGLMSALLVVRSTRAEEEAGRTELLRARAVGRDGAPVAALAVVATAVLAVAGGVAVGLVASGLEVAGSVALASSFAAFGLFMAAVALLTAQLTEHARAATGAAVGVLAASFVLRALGDVGSGELSWASPMGWALAVRPFGGERWAVLLLPLALGAALVALALALGARRDVGAGLLPARPGPARASRWLSSPLGLAVRLHRGSLLGWGTGLLLLGAAYGSVGDAVEDLVTDNEALGELLAGAGVDLVDSFFAVAAAMMALITGGFALQVATRLRSEETSGRAEPLLAAAVPRWRWAASHLLVAAVGSTAILLVSGLGLGLAHAALTGDAGQVPRMVGATLVHAPALWVLVGVVALLAGVLPAAVPAAWAVLVASAVALLLGETLQLPSWATAPLPFEHVPQVPAQSLDLLPLLVLTACAVALVAGGLAGLRSRDVG